MDSTISRASWAGSMRGASASWGMRTSVEAVAVRMEAERRSSASVALSPNTEPLPSSLTTCSLAPLSTYAAPRASKYSSWLASPWRKTWRPAGMRKSFARAASVCSVPSSNREKSGAAWRWRTISERIRREPHGSRYASDWRAARGLRRWVAQMVRNTRTAAAAVQGTNVTRPLPST
jgi:hypothetical protein